MLALAVQTNPAMFDRLLQEVYRETDRARLNDVIAVLSGVRDLKQQTTALGLVLDTRVDVRDTQFMFFGAQEEANWENAQRYIRDNRDAILARLPSEGTAVGPSILAYVFAASCSAERRDEIVEYVNRTFAVMPGGPRIVQQAVEGMDHCIAQRKLMEPEIRAWLGKPRAASTANARRYTGTR